MLKDKFLIGELARLFNISADTLRHYDRINLLKPETDKENSYRYYSLTNFFKLSRILFMKSLDISLEEIRSYMSSKNPEKLTALLRKKEEEIDHKLYRLQNLKHKIHTKVELMESVESDLDKITVRRIPERVGVFLEMDDMVDDCDIVQAFKKNKVHLHSSSWLIEGQIYTSLSRENMNKGTLNKFRYFIELVAMNEPAEQQTILIPESDYACITFRGPYRDMGRHYRILIDWIKKNGFDIAGDSIEKNIVDYGFSDSEDEYVSEIQIPIKGLS